MFLCPDVSKGTLGVTSAFSCIQHLDQVVNTLARNICTGALYVLIPYLTSRIAIRSLEMQVYKRLPSIPSKYANFLELPAEPDFEANSKEIRKEEEEGEEEDHRWEMTLHDNSRSRTGLSIR